MIGQEISRYKITAEIGHGGMGVVYQARDNSLNRDVALKILPPAMGQDELFLSRFEREAHTVARLEHPSIVPIYDFGTVDNQTFLVMRLLLGDTLRQRVDKRTVTVPSLLNTINQISAALDYAHQQGVIHRDIKPSNILFDEQGTAYLSDFGIAKLQNASIQLTNARAIGTAAYMSPEQSTGDPIDGKSDQYSLAVVVYEVLAGKPLFQGETLQLMYKHVHEPPDFSHLAQKFSAFVPVLSRALSKDASKRYDTVTQFAQALNEANEALKTTATRRRSRPSIPAPPPGQRGAKKTPTSGYPRTRAPRPETLLSVPQGKPPVIHKGAGGESSSKKRPFYIWLVPLLLVGVGIAAYMIWGSNLFPPAPPPPQQLALPESETGGTFLTVVEGGDGVLYEIDGNLERAPSDGRISIPQDDSDFQVQTTGEPAQIVLENQSTLYLAPNSTISFENFASELVLDNGELVAQAAPTGSGLIVKNKFGSTVLLLSNSIAGIQSYDDASEVVVDCLQENCKVFGDVGGEIILIEGERTVIGLNGQPQEATAAQYERYTQIAAVVPTPTATSEAIAEVTPTATATDIPPTATSTATAEPSPSPTVADATSTPEPTATPASQNSTGSASNGVGFPMDFTNFGIWVRGDEANGSFTASTAQSRGGQAGRLDYNFTTAENDYVVFLQLNDISGQPDTVNAWVYGDGSNHFLNVWIQDSEGQTWQVPMGQVTHQGWRQMSGALDTTQEWPWSHVSGSNNGRIDYPIRFRAIVLDDYNQTYTGSGTIFIDDITVATTGVAAVQPTIATGGGTTDQGGDENASPTSTPVPAATAAVFDGDLGRIIYTSGSTLLTTDPTWTAAAELGTAAVTSCSSTASTSNGNNFSLYYSPSCQLGEGTKVCTSPNGAYEVIVNGTFSDGFTISVKAASAEGTGTFIYGGSDINLDSGIRWNPNNSGFLFALNDSQYIAYPTGGYNALLPLAYTPNFSPDGTMILYRRPVGPGVNDIFVSDSSGTSAVNVTNNTAIDKRCPAWVLP